MKNILMLLIIFTFQSGIISHSVLFSMDRDSSYTRFFFRDSLFTRSDSKLRGDGLTSVITSWNNIWANSQLVRQHKIECYNNWSNLPVWSRLIRRYRYNDVDSKAGISHNGEFIALSCGNKIDLLNGQTGNEIWSYNVFNLADSTVDSTYRADLAEITRNGEIIIATIRGTIGLLYSPVYIVAFNKNSSSPIWYHCFETNWLNRSFIGINISANDSLVIANQYMNFYVIKTYTGEIIYKGIVNPYNPNNYGIGCRLGISGDGSIIAVGNNYGYLRVYKWNGITYNYLWEDQEPPVGSWNPVYAIDVSPDGKKIAAGAFITVNPNYSYTGRIRYYETDSGNVPLWIHTDSGRVNYLSFSNNGKILCAATDGSMFTRHENNLLIFHTASKTNVPVFAVCDYGSFWKCSVSDDGTTVIGTGKGAHSWEMGFGNIYYNIHVDTTFRPVGISNAQNKVPEGFYLYQNYPNPFNPVTKIKFSVGNSPLEGGKGGDLVKLTIYNALGKEVAVLLDEKLQAGTYEVDWEAGNYPSGVYFYKLESGNFSETKKIILLK